MAGHKHRLDDDGTSVQKSKKTKLLSDKPEKKTHKRDSVPSTSAMTLDAIDFPRGGGSTLTPLEVKTIRAEAVREADQELFDSAKQASVKPKQRKSDVKGKATEVDVQTQDTLRIEHLNYKRLMPGMRVLGQVMSIQPLAIVVSLPNQLFAHVPITQITSQLTHRLESTNDDEDEELDDNKSESSTQVPDLTDLFYVGQYVRAAVISTHPPGTTDMAGLGRVRDDAIKASRRVELSLLPEKVNVGVRKADLKIGYSLNAAVRSIEDHGYLLELGISGVSGFLSFKEAHKGDSEGLRLQLGALIHVSVIKMSSNGRICTLTNDSDVLASSSISEATNVASVLPGSLVQSLITAVVPGGLNLQILGFFDATADELHLPSTHSSLKVGKKVKARVLYDLPTTTPPRFVVTLAEHHIRLQPKSTSDGQALHTAFPVGTVLEAVTVRQVEAERGLLVEVQPGQEGFVHISHVSDEHIPNLSASSGPWGPNTLHKARVIGHHPFDGILQLSLRPSVLEQRFIQAGQVQVGEVLKGIVKRLTDSALFVSISGNVDGVIWPVHYADIPLKHPSKKFKAGGNIKCRVLTVDPERNRVVLTAKKTLLDTTFPILTSFSDAKAGFLTHAVIFRVTDKYLMVEFFNNVKAVVPAREASETGAKLTDIYAPGKVIKVRVISVQPEAQRIVASIRQATSSFTSSVTDISGVLIGDTVEGVVTQLHKLNVMLSLKPSDVRALISFSGLARHWNTTVPELKTLLKPGASIGSLASSFVVVTGYSKSDQQKKVTLSMDNIIVGQIVLGRITKYARFGAHIKLTTRISGSLHPTDTSDDYEAGNTFPAVDSILRAAVVGIDRPSNHLFLSTRPSRLSPNDVKQPVDREINSIDDLKAGDTVRGFIKSVAEHGLFVMLGRGIDARVQIRELFDEYIKDWKSRFVVNQLVRGRILNIDTANKKVEMTFRSGDLTRAPSNSLTLSDLREGQKVAGRVKRIEQYGIFIGIEGSKISGLCHKSQLSDNKDADVTIALRTFREGDRVRAFIISRDLEKKQLSLGLKPSYFAGDDDEVVSDSEHPQENKLGVTDNVKTHGSDLGEEHPQDSGSDEEELVTIGDGHDDDDDRDDIMEVDLTPPDLTNASKLPGHQDKDVTPLKVDGFQWFKDDAIPYEQSSQSESSDQSDGEEGSAGRKKRKRRKEIETDVTADMQTKMPDSNADFERRLLGSPNSSYLWIQYMSFQLQLSEIDKARAIGKRAIQTIHFREEQEKLNVWIALLNLENVYGTDATMETVFKDAMRYNDSKTIHLRLAAIFDESQKYEKAEDQYKRTCKKFGQSSKVWTLFCEHYLRRGQVEDARKLLSRSLQSLEKRKHIKTISKFAQLEYKLGDVERGRTIFEGIVDSHPKRWDIWSVYMDMEARNGDIQHLRNLFDHVLAIKMTSHKAKAFFKKWLDLERKLGDEEGATAVKQKAVEWTQMAAEVA
ncbi:U3 snoRNP-associated protein Rrp5 [Boletus edulis BED1]|uniref:U3 snoRNP-associated protein Rrp5 n=1 Tax=Boletus edulis BED1 TaxID=1328754 RepID=A0AAD4C140_BOLED|nr:U3 snoRNP-associated protein Rrp5 [Boletus edulis BED1]